MSKFLSISDYDYPLPPEQIAQYPLAQRDQSRLLCYRRGTISHRRFYQLPDLLPGGALLVFNNAQVIPARLLFRRETGALIEVFLLEPVAPSTLPEAALAARESTVWRCMVGNRKKWRAGETLSQSSPLGPLHAHWENRAANTVRLSWQGEASFAEMLEASGKVPLPPYLEREAEPADRERYQTVFSRVEGSVAAPTAGLHFTEEVLQALNTKGFPSVELTLHVGAGTFKPVSGDNALEHPMHHELFSVEQSTIRRLLEHPGPIIAIGTTALRTLESLYWCGVKRTTGRSNPLRMNTEDPEQLPQEVPLRESLSALLHPEAEALQGSTGLYIYPGYRFRVVQGLLTNFHQPRSTLLLLVAALVGQDWQRIYRQAMNQDYRFLSYGDASLLLP